MTYGMGFKNHGFDENHILKVSPELPWIEEAAPVTQEAWDKLKFSDLEIKQAEGRINRTPKFDRNEITYEKNNKLFKLYELAELGYVPAKGFQFAYDTVKLTHVTRLQFQEIEKLTDFNPCKDYSKFVQKVIANYVSFPERWTDTFFGENANIRTEIPIKDDPVEDDCW